MFKNNLVLVFLVFFQPTHSNFLFTKGWYKSEDKVKLLLENVTSIDDSIIPASLTDLKLKARIPELYEGGVKNLESLLVLTLSRCQIEEILPGAFENVPNLDRIQLKENNLGRIRGGVFNFMNVSVLFLNKNKIEVIDSDAFDNMPKLYKIKLNNNMLSSWDSNWFTNTPKLVKFFFKRNHFELLQEDVFKNIIQSNDTSIFLSKNHIKSIHPNAFRGIKTLGQVWLDRNNLTQLYGNMFADLDTVETLMLTKNKIKELPVHLFKNTKVMLLDIGVNPLKCVPYEVVSKVEYTHACRVRQFGSECLRELRKKLKEHNLKNEIQANCD